MNNLKIFKIYHNSKLEETYPFVDDGIRIKYSTETNIWGRYLNEFCVWFDDTINTDCDFIGLEHYRRSFELLNTYNKDFYLNKLTNNKAYVFEKRFVIPHIPYLKYIELPLFETQLLNYFEKNKMYKELNMVKVSNLLIWRSMFIITHDNFINYLKFITDIKNYLFEINNINEPNDIEILKDSFPESCTLFNMPYRVFAYIFEYLTNIWLLCNTKEQITLDMVK